VEERPPIGATLREARLRQDLEISECARATRIRERYLVAIEDGRFESLPDPAYVNGFVRAYATHLGVTVDGPVRELPRDHQLSPLPARARPVRVRATRATARNTGRRGPWWTRAKIVVPLLIVAGVAVLQLIGAIDLPLG
jgi:cytoskeleton protein RodZ